MNKYTKNTKVKAGIFEKKSVKGKDLLLYIKQNFPTEFEDSIKRIITFDNDRYSLCIHSQKNYLSKPQKGMVVTYNTLSKRQNVGLD